MGSKNQGWPAATSDQWVRQCQRLKELDGRLVEIVKGEAKPEKEGEEILFALLCTARNHPATAVRYYEQAFSANPELIKDVWSDHRYAAAMQAALAGSGLGKDDRLLDESHRSKLRKRALEMLTSDFDLLKKQLESGDRQAKATVLLKLRQWQRQTELAGIRDKTALARLPASERETCRKLWDPVNSLVAQLREPRKPATLAQQSADTTKPGSK
jgi:hypothetical protein